MPKSIVVSEAGLNKAVVQEVRLRPPEAGEMLIKNLYSSINYKDALAVTGKGKILRNLPLTPGIDTCGEVIESRSEHFKIGDIVFQTGGNLGEVYNGGLSESVILHEKNALLLPKGLSAKEIMVLGTAGFTAALAIYRMELNHLKNNLPIAVTGASGGVGSFAVQILKNKSYKVLAVTSKSDAHEWLKNLGADEVISPGEVLLDKSIASVRWAGAIDNLGGDYLTSLIAQTDLYGQVASVGLAQSYKLNATVMPFILRGVNLLGVSSNNCPMNWRKDIWTSLATEFKPKYLEATHEITLDQVVDFSNELLARKIKGRILVKF